MYFTRLISILMVLFIFSEIHGQVLSLQYRAVPGEHIEDFVHRETTYWSQVAQKAIDNKQMIAWELWERVGGWDLDDNSSNFVFVNVFEDVKALDNLSEMWGAIPEVLPNMRMSDMETNSLSKVTASLYLNGVAGFGNGGNYAVVNYSLADDTDNFIEFETKSWLPFITSAMNSGKTSVKGWSAYTLMSPSGTYMPFNVMSVDQYDKMSDALSPDFDESLEFPDMTEYSNHLERKYIGIYRLVKRLE